MADKLLGVPGSMRPWRSRAPLLTSTSFPLVGVTSLRHFRSQGHSGPRVLLVSAILELPPSAAAHHRLNRLGARLPILPSMPPDAALPHRSLHLPVKTAAPLECSPPPPLFSREKTLIAGALQCPAIRCCAPGCQLSSNARRVGICIRPAMHGQLGQNI